MIGFIGNIEKATLGNNNFRTVVYTAPHSQLVLMSLLPNEEIGVETHYNVDQFFRIEQGEGKIVLNGEEYAIFENDAVVIPAGVKHNLINTSDNQQLKLYTIYSPANHKDGTIHKTKADADKDEEDHNFK